MPICNPKFEVLGNDMLYGVEVRPGNDTIENELRLWNNQTGSIIDANVVEVKKYKTMGNLFRYAGKCVAEHLHDSSQWGALLDIYDESVNTIVREHGVQVIYWRSINPIPDLENPQRLMA